MGEGRGGMDMYRSILKNSPLLLTIAVIGQPYEEPPPSLLITGAAAGGEAVKMASEDLFWTNASTEL